MSPLNRTAVDENKMIKLQKKELGKDNEPSCR